MSLSKITEKKLASAKECLATNNITAATLLQAYIQFQKKHPRMDSYAVLCYVGISALRTVENEASAAFIKQCQESGVEPEYPQCPSCSSNHFSKDKKTKTYVCTSCGLEYRWDKKRKQYEAI